VGEWRLDRPGPGRRVAADPGWWRSFGRVVPGLSEPGDGTRGNVGRPTPPTPVSARCLHEPALLAGRTSTTRCGAGTRGAEWRPAEQDCRRTWTTFV